MNENIPVEDGLSTLAVAIFVVIALGLTTWYFKGASRPPASPTETMRSMRLDNELKSTRLLEGGEGSIRNIEAAQNQVIDFAKNNPGKSPFPPPKDAHKKKGRAPHKGH